MMRSGLPAGWAPTPDAELTPLLAGLEAELHHPGAACSRERLEALLHPDFHEVGRSGLPYDRATVLDFLARQGGDPQVRAWGHAAHRLAPHAALLTFCSARVSAQGELSHAARRLSVWRQDASGWRLFYHQGTPLPADGPPPAGPACP
ncbi:nuclear transport factor 2 family protein [Ideonella livida]|uniref:Nuclear transport factor 2 family protein n=1 Tax=Ideonella livida TaxID=2707176 RepID=A0A7C9PJN3_9BURK|nr:DUF4440 domain-containing protein [Ideonella livida]NDY93369.1 nuclear transport factor 2 family protein [Ideonella livida]